MPGGGMADHRWIPVFMAVIKENDIPVVSLSPSLFIL